MKSEHRHELKTNELGRIAEQVGQYLQRYANHLIIGLSALLLVAAVAIYWARTSGGAAASGWSAMFTARTAEDYANLADQYRGSLVGDWARLREAQMHLENGIRLLFTDRAAGISDLSAAKESFEAILNSSNVTDGVRERALFGMARTLESLSDGDAQQAIAAYETLLQEFPDTIYQREAEERLADLQVEQTQEFYAWFHQQNPNPPDRDQPIDGQADGPFGVGGETEGNGLDPEDAAEMPGPARAEGAAQDDAAQPEGTVAPETPSDDDSPATDDASETTGARFESTVEPPKASAENADAGPKLSPSQTDDDGNADGPPEPQ